MIKRVPCKVISSTNTSTTSTNLQPAAKIEQLQECDELNTANYWLKPVYDTIGSLNIFNINNCSLNSPPAGQILDCLA